MFNQALLIQKNLLPSNLNRFSCQRLISCRYFKSARAAETFSDRTFSSTSYQMGTKKHRPPKKNLQSSSVTAEPTALRPPTNKATYKTFAETLSLRRSPTLLYQAQSRTRFIVGCYLLSGFCIAWAVTNFRNEVLYPLQRLPGILTITTSGVSVFMFACGCWLIARVRCLIPRQGFATRC